VERVADGAQLGRGIEPFEETKTPTAVRLLCRHFDLVIVLPDQDELLEGIELSVEAGLPP